VRSATSRSSAAAAIGFLTARTGNRFGALLASPDGPRSSRPAAGRNHLMATLHRVVDRPPGRIGHGRPGVAPSTASAPTARRRGLVAVVSDLLDRPRRPGPPPLRRQVSARHDGHRGGDHRSPGALADRRGPAERGRPGRRVAPGRCPPRPASSAPGTKQRRPSSARRTAASDPHLRRADHLVLRTDRDWLLDVVRFVVDAQGPGARAPRRLGHPLMDPKSGPPVP
jgi:uncharacterized protein (DUF58 family)